MDISTNFESVCYTRNFLGRVIFRIDFQTEISYEVINSTSMVKAIMGNFPVSEKDRIVYEGRYKLTFNKSKPGVAPENATQVVEKAFTDSEKTKKLIFSEKYLIVEIYQYTVFDDLLKYVDEILENIDCDIAIRRMGLRYINNYEFKEKRIFSFNKYFNKDLLSFSFMAKLDSNILPKRALNIQEYAYEENNIKFQYGLYNPEFPAPIKKKAFVLDYDGYYQGLIDDKKAILPKFKELHRLIQYFFEKSITDKMKDEMDKE